MAYHRSDSPHYFAMLRTETGHRGTSLRTSNKTVANHIERMWERLASEYRAWDLLVPVLDGERSIGSLYDAYTATNGSLAAMRERLAGVDLAPLVDDFLAEYAAGGRVAGTVENVTIQLRWLIPPGKSFPSSRADPEQLSKALTRYGGKPNTRRKVHTAWTLFFDYVARTTRRLASNPMHGVPRPKPYRPPVRFYEREEVEKIIRAAPSPAMRALWSLMYGSGAEITPSLKLRRRDFIEARKEVRIRATKERSRDRVVRVGDAQWPHVKAHLTTLKPADMVWPGWRRWWPTEAHRAAVTDLGLDPLPLYCSRHHWAASRARIGTPIPVIQHQLGHNSPRQTLEVYSRFLPASEDRERWEKLLTRTTRRTTVAKKRARAGQSKKSVTV